MITLFDVPSTVPDKAWNAVVWKTRFPLNYKGIPHKTVWLEYPEIAPVLKENSIPPTKTKEDGSPHYTLPAILDIDDDTGAVKACLADSVTIARYLDEAYPATPKILPEDKEALAEQEKFGAEWMFTMFPTLIILSKLTVAALNEGSQEYFSRARAKDLHQIYKIEKLEDLPLTQEHRQDLWAQGKVCFDAFDAQLKEREEKNGGPWYNGEKATFIDFVIGGYLMWVRTVFGKDSAEWKNIMQWNNKRWATMVERLEPYTVVA